MIKRFFEAIRGAFEAIRGAFEAIRGAFVAAWEHEIIGGVIRALLMTSAVIALFFIAIIAFTGWAYIFLLIIR